MTDVLGHTGADLFVPMLVEMMVSGRFVRGQTVRRLAEEHGVPVSTMRNYSQLASRLAWNDSEDDIAEMKATSIGRLQTISLKAERDAAAAPPIAKAGLYGAATGAIKTAAEIGGVLKKDAPVVNVLVDAKGQMRPDVTEFLQGAIARLGRALSAETPDVRRRVLERYLADDDSPTTITVHAEGAKT